MIDQIAYLRDSNSELHTISLNPQLHAEASIEVTVAMGRGGGWQRGQGGRWRGGGGGGQGGRWRGREDGGGGILTYDPLMCINTATKH